MNETLDPTIKNLASAIKKQESGTSSDPYNAKGASGEHGAYQFMPDTWKAWAGKHLGNPNAPLTVENQNKVAYNQIKEWKDKGYNPAQVAAAWNAGEGSLANDKWKTNVGTNTLGVKYDTPTYVKNVSKNYEDLKSKATPLPTVDVPRSQDGFDLSGFPSVMKPEYSPTANVLSTVTDPVQQMGLGVANTLNPLLDRAPITSLPGIAGDNVQAPGYDAQGNWMGGMKAAEMMGGAAIQTGANLAIPGVGGKVANMLGKSGGIAGKLASAAISNAPIGAAMFGGQAMSEGKGIGDVAVESGKGALTTATLGVGGEIAGALATKLSGVNAKMIDDVINLRRTGKTAEADALEKTPAYQQVLKANGLDDKNLDKSIDEITKELKIYEDTGISKSGGVAQGRRNATQAKIDDEKRLAWLENARTPESVENPFAATQSNIEKNREIIGNNTADVIDAARASKIEILPMNTDSILKQVKADLYDNGVQGSDLVRAEKMIKQDLIDRAEQAAEQGRRLDVADFYNMKVKANSTYGGESFGSQVSTTLGNILRKELDSATKSTDPFVKDIITHLRNSDGAYSKLKQAEEYNKFLQGMPGGRPSKVINLMAGYGLGGGPVGGMAMMFMTDKLQQRLINARSNRIVKELAGKVRGMSTNDLIGDAQKTIEKINSKKAVQVADELAIKANSDKEKAVAKLMETLRPKTDAELPTIQMGNTAKSKYNKSDPSLPTIRGMATPNSLNAMTALTGLMGAYGVAQDKFGKETYTREVTPEVAAPDIDTIAERIANAETRGEKTPYSTKKWSNRKLGPASPLGRDLGKYQITSARLREKSKDFLGRVVSDNEFLKSPELQDTFIREQIKWQLSHGMTEDEIYATHRRGWGNLKPEQIKKAVATSTGYIESAKSK